MYIVYSPLPNRRLHTTVFSIAPAGHCHRKPRRGCQIVDDVIVTLTHDLLVWAISPTPWPLPDNTQHWQQTDFHAPRWDSNPQSHQATNRLLPIRIIRTSEMSLSYWSASISCRLSGLIKNTEFRLSKSSSSRQKTDGVSIFLSPAGSVWRTHRLGSPSLFRL